MYTYDVVREELEPIYRKHFLDWVQADSMEMPAFLCHLGRSLISMGVDLDRFQVQILEDR